MEIKKDLDISTDDFYYDICNGYLVASEICANIDDVEKVNTAIDILTDFENSCGEQIEGFYR